MKIAEQALPKEEESDDWKWNAVEEMKLSNRLKFENCPHSCEYLLQTTGCIVEATTNPIWGSGLILDMTRMMLKDYWPGKNNLRQILMELWGDVLKSIRPQVPLIEPPRMCINNGCLCPSALDGHTLHGHFECQWHS